MPYPQIAAHKSCQNYHARLDLAEVHRPDCSEHEVPQQTCSTVALQQAQAGFIEPQRVDLFQPLLDPDMLGLSFDTDVPDFAQFDTPRLNLNYLDIEGWDQGFIRDGGPNASTDTIDMTFGAN